MTGLNLRQFQLYIVQPTLKSLDLYSKVAERLVIGTALAESGLVYLDQVEKGGDRNPGPSFGLFQMEAATYHDICNNFLKYKPDLQLKVNRLIIGDLSAPEQMAGNLYYAAAMCRIHYYRRPEALPRADDLASIAGYWKKFYNTSAGKGTIQGFCEKAAAIMQI